MKILLVTSEYGEQGGGLSLACSKFYHLLRDSLGNDVSVISSSDNTIITAQGGYNPALKKYISSEYRLKMDVLSYQNSNIDLIIAFSGSYNGYYAAMLSKHLKSSLYLMLRGTDINMAKWDSQEILYIREAGMLAKKIICLSKEMLRNTLDILPSATNKCIVIPNIIDPLTKGTFFPNLPNKIVVGCSATHINEKKGISNLLYVIKAFKEISNIKPFLHIIGNIDADLLDEYKKMAHKLSILKNVHFDGYKSREECLEEQKQWDFYIQGSVCEGFCNSVGECISSGIPVFLSNTGFISETLHNHFPQMIYNSFYPHDIASKLLELVNLKDKNQLYADAYSFIYSQTNEEKVLNMWRAVLNNKPITINPIKRAQNILAVALHEVKGNQHDPITTPESEFSDFIERLYSHGYGICSFKDYLKKHKEEKDKWIVCTFDDGYASLIDKVFPLFQNKGVTATVFINSSFIGKDNSWNWKDSKRRKHLNVDDIKRLYESGWEIGSHGHTHRNLLQLSEKELEYEFTKSKKILTNIAGSICTFAYPYGASSTFVRNTCNRYYDYAFALYEGGTELHVDNMKIRRYSIDDIIKILEL